MNKSKKKTALKNLYSFPSKKIKRKHLKNGTPKAKSPLRKKNVNTYYLHKESNLIRKQNIINII